ncbi:hypothetical protein Ahy_B07g086486 [Arachis hypogaea]|uniref:Uncharacterized protein n=1 Tax=Arachis hypogaea TaxID=3818 RepID=A0A444Y9T4_ARAHY|nr:hypothetical protein Ahy_B07g086486 [Arachis hypogaea]
MENNQFFFVVVYPNGIVRHGDEGVIFESDKTVRLNTNRVDSLDALKTIMLSNMGGVSTKEVRRVAYRFLHALPNGGFTNQLFWIDGDQHVRVMFGAHARLMPQHVMELYATVYDVVVGGRPSPLSPKVFPLEATLIHYAQPHDSADEDDNDGDSTYIFLKMSMCWRLLATVLVDGGVEFQVGHRFRNHEAVLMVVKNYSIRWNAEYRILELDSLKCHCRCKQFTNSYSWSLSVALQQNLNYWYMLRFILDALESITEVRRFSGLHTRLAPTMSQNHAQLDSGLICKVMLPMIKTDPSVSIPVLQSTECLPGTIHGCVVVPYYNGDMVNRELSQFDKVFWALPLYIEALKHCKPFVSVDGTHLYEKYGGMMLIAVA